MSSKIFIAFFATLSFLSAAQSPQLSSYEVKWAAGHPFAALKVKKISKRCNAWYLSGNVKQQLDSFASGGQLDAYRHAFYMAAYAQKIKIKKIRKLGRA